MAIDVDLIGDKLKSAIELNSRFAAELLDLSTIYLRSLGAILATRGEQEGKGRTEARPDVVPPLLLAAPAGEQARGSILLRNTLAHPVTARVVPLGAGVASTVTVTPATAPLEPGEQLVLQVSVSIDAGLEVNDDHPGELAIPELSSRAIPFVVRRLPDTSAGDRRPEATALRRQRVGPGRRGKEVAPTVRQVPSNSPKSASLPNPGEGKTRPRAG